MRGKHGAAAAVRHEVQSAQEQIETYQAAVRRLTAEKQELARKLAQQAEAHRRLERELRARLDQAAAPEVEALRTHLAKAKDEIEKRRQMTNRLAEQTDRAAEALREAWVELGADNDEAIERGYEVMPWRSGLRIGKPDRWYDMTGRRSIASSGVPIAPRFAEAALDGDEEALERFRAMRKAYGPRHLQIPPNVPYVQW